MTTGMMMKTCLWGYGMPYTGSRLDNSVLLHTLVTITDFFQEQHWWPVKQHIKFGTLAVFCYNYHLKVESECAACYVET